MTSPASALRELAQEPAQNLAALRRLSALAAADLPENPKSSTTIAVVGLRGVGKSTLALMAAAELGFVYVDAETCVSSHTGQPDAMYLQSVSVEAYQALQARLITAKVAEHAGESMIVVMPSAAVSSPPLRALLAAEFRFVINVECEEERILQYMAFAGTAAEGTALVRRNFDAFRSISTHDYFNSFSAAPHSATISAAAVDRTSSFFALKPAQKDFTRFVAFLTRGADAAAAVAGNLHLRANVHNTYSNCLQVDVPGPALAASDLVGVDFLELRLDMLRLIQPGAARLGEILSRYRRLSHSAVPVLVSVHWAAADLQPFADKHSEAGLDAVRVALREFYLSLLGSAVRLGVDYVCVQLDMFEQQENSLFFDPARPKTPVADLVVPVYRHFAERCGNTVLVASCHFEDSASWGSTAFEALEVAQRLQAPVVRLSAAAARRSDTASLLSFRAAASQRHPAPTICAYNTGPWGKVTKATNQMFTPVAAAAAPGDEHFTAVALTRALADLHLLPRLRFYIMGSNVAESASPRLHGETYSALGLPYRCELYECDALQPHLSRLVQTPDFGGAAILMPFKAEALHHVDAVSGHVKVIGALNTIVPQRPFDRPDQVVGVRGENTDWLGVRIALQDNTSPYNAGLAAKTALVLGAGGMARSALYALIQLGYSNILLHNRTKARAHELAHHYNQMSPLLPSRSLTTGRMCDSQKELRYFRVVVLEDADFLGGVLPPSVSAYPVSIVSCVPSPHTGAAIHENWFSSASGGVVLETGYKPYSAVLERGSSFRDRGWVAVHGLNWLLAQAIAQFEMFTNKQAPVALMKQVVCSLHDMHEHEK